MVVSKSWNDTINYPKKIKILEISQKDWKNLHESIDFNNFQKLPEVIGCPDCADGGASWVEISRSNVVFKVTFDYQNPPSELHNLISNFR